MKFDDSVLWLLVWCTAVAAGDMELLLWFSVDGDTMVGGVDDSYPELAAGDGCDPGLVDSWTFSKNEKMGLGRGRRKRYKGRANVFFLFTPCVVVYYFVFCNVGFVFLSGHDIKTSPNKLKPLI